MRDIKKQAEQGRKVIDKRKKLDLTAGELNQFFEEFKRTAKEEGVSTGLYNAIADAFYMGLAAGIRNNK